MKGLLGRSLPLLFCLLLAPAALAQDGARAFVDARDEGGAKAGGGAAPPQAAGGDLLPDATNRRDVGSASRRWNNIFSRTAVLGDRDEPALYGVTLLALTGGTEPATGNTNDWVAWFRHEGDAANNEALMRLQHYSAGYVPQPIFTGIGARGNKASPGALQNGDYLFILDGRGHDGTRNNYRQGNARYPELGFTDTAAQVAFSANGNWSGANHGTRISFKIIPSGSTTLFTVADMTNYAFNVKGQFVLESAGTHVNTAGANNNDVAGVVVISGATSGSKTFNAPYGNNPACVLTPVQDMGAVRWWVGTSPKAVTANVSAAGSYQFYFHCFGNPN